MKNKLSKGYEETYFFVFKPEGVYYNELETRLVFEVKVKFMRSGHYKVL